MLHRDLTGNIYKPGTRECVVVSGTLADPYTATRIDFVRGDGNLVDIDHLVALSNAWVSGAARQDIKVRTALANDPLNLLAVEASANRQKGDSDAATWLPANKGFRCRYVAGQISVKSKYSLSVTPAEKDAMNRVLLGCPNEPLPSSTAPVIAPITVREPAAPAPGAPTKSVSSPAAGTSYRNCSEARAAGAAPVMKGQPGYGRHLDRDGDGVGCQ